MCFGPGYLNRPAFWRRERYDRLCRPPTFLVLDDNGILAQERLDKEEAQSMLAVARRMHDERMATIID